MSYQLKLWDSKRERKLTARTHCRLFAEQRDWASPEKSSRSTDRPSPAGGRRHGGGERGRLGPKDGIPYHTANRPPVSDQRPPEILGGRHPPGGSWWDTGRRHWTGAGGDWGWGRGGQKARRTRGECARQAPDCLSRSGGEDAKSRRSFLFRAFMEHPRAGTAGGAGPAPYRAAGSLSSAEGKSAPAPSRSATEPATRMRGHLRPPVSGRKLGTEETNRRRKQKPNKQRGPLQKGPVQQIKIPVGNTDYTGRGL